jgi:putative hemolysin
MGSSRRWGIRALAVLAVTSVTVLALATAAGATTVRIFKGSANVVEGYCDPPGNLTVTTDANGVKTAVCVYKDGTVVTCVDTSCVSVTPRKLQSLLTHIRAVGGSEVRKVSDNSKVWVQTAPTKVKDAVGAMRDGVCPSLGGEFVGSSEGTVGVCRTPTGTVVCQNTTSKNTCSGVADTTNQAGTVRKVVRNVLQGSPAFKDLPPPPTTGASAPRESTTTTGATTTTRATTPTTRGVTTPTARG